MTQLAELRGRVIRFTEESPDNKRLGDDELFGLENDYKVYFGRLQALDDPAFMADSARGRGGAAPPGQAEARRGLRRSVGGHGPVQQATEALYPPYLMVERGPMDSRLFDDARILVRAAQERAKPSDQRLPGYADSQLPATGKAGPGARADRGAAGAAAVGVLAFARRAKSSPPTIP